MGVNSTDRSKEIEAVKKDLSRSFGRYCAQTGAEKCNSELKTFAAGVILTQQDLIDSLNRQIAHLMRKKWWQIWK